MNNSYYLVTKEFGLQVSKDLNELYKLAARCVEPWRIEEVTEDGYRFLFDESC